MMGDGRRAAELRGEEQKRRGEKKLNCNRIDLFKYNNTALCSGSGGEEERKRRRTKRQQRPDKDWLAAASWQTAADEKDTQECCLIKNRVFSECELEWGLLSGMKTRQSFSPSDKNQKRKNGVFISGECSTFERLTKRVWCHSLNCLKWANWVEHLNKNHWFVLTKATKWRYMNKVASAAAHANMFLHLHTGNFWFEAQGWVFSGRRWKRKRDEDEPKVFVHTQRRGLKVWRLQRGILLPRWRDAKRRS